MFVDVSTVKGELATKNVCVFCSSQLLQFLFGQLESGASYDIYKLILQPPQLKEKLSQGNFNSTIFG